MVVVLLFLLLLCTCFFRNNIFFFFDSKSRISPLQDDIHQKKCIFSFFTRRKENREGKKSSNFSSRLFFGLENRLEMRRFDPSFVPLMAFGQIFSPNQIKPRFFRALPKVAQSDLNYFSKIISQFQFSPRVGASDAIVFPNTLISFFLCGDEFFR